MHRLCASERDIIHGILDEAENELLGDHSPYETLKALDEHCAQLFPGWKKSVNAQKPPAPIFERPSVNFVTEQIEPEEPELDKKQIVEKGVTSLKDDLQRLISRIGGSLPPELIDQHRNGAADTNPEIQAQTDAKLTKETSKSPKRKKKVGKAKIKELERELEALQKEKILLRKQMRKVKQELTESQDRVTQLKVRFRRSEVIRQKMNKQSDGV